jgi:hypothetical protein
LTGRRLAYIAGLLLGKLALVGARAGLRTEPPAVSLLKMRVPRGNRKPPVQFSHKVHETRRVACTQCHYDYRNGRNVWHQGQPVQPCRACHALRRKARTPDLKDAFHRQCKGCHLQLKQRGRLAGPITCRGCHGSA